MIIYHQINNTQPKNFTKISKNFKKPKSFKKNPKPRSNAWNAWEKRDLMSYHKIEAWLTWREWRLEWEKSVWRERKDFLSRERSENEIWFRVELYIEKWRSIDWGAIEIYRALNLDRCESVEVLSRICRQQKYLDGSKSYRESIGQTGSYSMDRKIYRASI